VSSRFQLKLRLPNSIHRVSLSYIPNWDQFNSYLSTDFFKGNIVPVSVEYKDDENDMITISCQVEWEELVNSHKEKLVNLWIKPKPIISSSTISPSEDSDAESLKQQDEIVKQQNLKNQELEEKAKQEALKLQQEELKKQRELEDKAKQEALKIQQDLEEKAKQEELKKQQAEKHRICVETLKEMEKEIKVKEQEQVPKKDEKNTKPIPVYNFVQKANNNKYIKQYSSKLQTLYEAGFIDIERNLYLLVTFNGNIEAVIEKLLELK